MALIEAAAQVLPASTYCRHRVVTSAIDAFVDLLVIHQSRRIVYVEGHSPACVRWNILKARATKSSTLRIIFPNEHTARTAQKLADELKTSGKAGGLEISCLTVDAALKQLTDSNDLDLVKP